MSSCFLFYSNPEGDFQPLLDSIEQNNPRAAFILGQLDLEHPLKVYLEQLPYPIRIFYVAGGENTTFRNMNSLKFDANMKLGTTPLKIDGITLAGLSGVFRQEVWMPGKSIKHSSRRDLASSEQQILVNGEISPRFNLSIFPEDLEALKEHDFDLLLMTDLPTFSEEIETEISKTLQNKNSVVIHSKGKDRNLKTGETVIGLGKQETFILDI